MTETQLRELLAEYLTILQGHPSAEEIMEAVLTEDFETGFMGGVVWKGLDGLRDFLSQRDGFFDEKHTITEVFALTAPRTARCTRVPGSSSSCGGGRRLPPPATSSPARAFTPGVLRRMPDRWRVAAQIVERFDNLNDNAERLFATPDEGLNR